MKEIAEASREILEAFAPIGEERVPLLSALGRHLSRDFTARQDLPAFDNSAMDGYALVAADIAGATHDAPAALPVIGESRAGGPIPPPLAPKSAMRIFTGAPLPAGADAVVLQEDTRRSDDVVSVLEAARAGDNVRKQGSDLRVGARALARGARLGPGALALLASQDAASVHVYRRPRVAILSTGDELRDIGEPARPGTIVNSNAYALAAQVREADCEPWVLPTVPDRLDDARASIRAGLAADVVVLSGGVSVGEYDVVRDALVAEGIELSFWKVRMKPGKPLAFAQKGRVPVLGLPGNPVSAWVTFELFVRPGLRKMLGDAHPERPRITVTLAEPITRKAGRTELARARLVRREGGLVAQLAARQGSGSLPALAEVDALVVIPGDAERIDTSQSLEAILLSYPH